MTCLLYTSISAIRSLGGGIQGPAVSAAIPQLVPREQLVRINGIQSTIGNATQLLSPILGGLALTCLLYTSVSRNSFVFM